MPSQLLPLPCALCCSSTRTAICRAVGRQKMLPCQVATATLPCPGALSCSPPEERSRGNCPFPEGGQCTLYLAPLCALPLRALLVLAAEFSFHLLALGGHQHLEPSCLSLSVLQACCLQARETQPLAASDSWGLGRDPWEASCCCHACPPLEPQEDSRVADQRLWRTTLEVCWASAAGFA